jgi:hypothetical protein
MEEISERAVSTTMPQRVLDESVSKALKNSHAQATNEVVITDAGRQKLSRRKSVSSYEPC